MGAVIGGARADGQRQCDVILAGGSQDSQFCLEFCLLGEHVLDGTAVCGGVGGGGRQFGAIEVAPQITASSLRGAQCLSVGVVGCGNRPIDICVSNDVLGSAGRGGTGSVGGGQRRVEALGGGEGGQGHASQAQVCSGRGDVEWVGIGGGEEVVELCLCPVDLGEICVVLDVGVGPLVDHFLHRLPVGSVGFG